MGGDEWGTILFSVLYLFITSKFFLEVTQQFSLPTSLATTLTACSLTRGIEQGCYLSDLHQ